MGFIKALLILLFALLIIVVYFYFQYEKKPVSNNSPSATSTAVTEASNTPASSSPSSEPPASAEPAAQPSASSEQSATPASTAAPSPAASQKMPADDQGTFTKGVDHFNRMDYDKAIVCFREVTAKNPKNIFAHYQLFLCYVQTEPGAWTKKSGAYREAKQIMSLKPDDQMKKQIDTYFRDVATRESTVIEPAPIKASPSKGPSGTPSKSPSGTPTVAPAPTPTEIETASAPPPLGQNGGVPTISNKDADMHYERARNYDKIGNYRFAVAEYTAAIKINSKHFDAYVSRGSLYESKGEYGNAAGDYTKAISLKPQDAKSYYRRAMLYKTMQDRDKAKADLQKTKELDSSMSDKVDLILKELEAQK